MEKRKTLGRNFSLMVAGQIISLFGNAILRFSLPLYLLRTTINQVSSPANFFGPVLGGMLFGIRDISLILQICTMSFFVAVFSTTFSLQMLALIQTETPEHLTGKVTAGIMAFIFNCPVFQKGFHKVK